MVAFPWSLDVEPPPTTAERKRWRFFERHLPNLSIGLMALMLVAAVLYPYMVITVPSGQVGVLWKRFNGFGIYCWCWVGRGTVLNPEELRGEGLHLIWPWNRLFIYDLRLQNATETYNAISKEGVSLSATINIRFQLRHNSVAVLHKFIGPRYEALVVSPEIGSRTREVMAQYTAEQIYSTSRQAIEEEIRRGAERRLSENLNKLVQPQASEQADMMAAPEKYTTTLKDAILIIDTLVLGIELPAPIVGAINRKIEQYYLVQEYTYRVEREMKELERKQIEANGIHAFQQTVSQGISRLLPALARHRGDACARSVHEQQDRHRRRREGRPTDHSRQRGRAGTCGSTAGRNATRGHTTCRNTTCRDTTCRYAARWSSTYRDAPSSDGRRRDTQGQIAGRRREAARRQAGGAGRLDHAQVV